MDPRRKPTLAVEEIKGWRRTEWGGALDPHRSVKCHPQGVRQEGWQVWWKRGLFEFIALGPPDVARDTVASKDPDLRPQPICKPLFFVVLRDADLFRGQERAIGASDSHPGTGADFGQIGRARWALRTHLLRG